MRRLPAVSRPAHTASGRRPYAPAVSPIIVLSFAISFSLISRIRGVFSFL